jgi:hypothetical protein
MRAVSSGTGSTEWGCGHMLSGTSGECWTTSVGTLCILTGEFAISIRTSEEPFTELHYSVIMDNTKQLPECLEVRESTFRSRPPYAKGGRPPKAPSPLAWSDE